MKNRSVKKTVGQTDQIDMSKQANKLKIVITSEHEGRLVVSVAEGENGINQRQ